MNFLKIITFCLLVSVLHVTRVENTRVKVKIECKEIYEHRWWYLDGKYVTCRDWPSSLIIEKKGVVLDEVVHPNGTKVERVENIKALSIIKATMKFLPKGIKDKFPSLKAIDIASCGMTHLDIDNMKQFGSDLEYASFGQNEITVLRANLFQFNPRLIAINFNSNPLKIIEPDFFVNLVRMNELVSVTLWNCECIDDGFGVIHRHNIETFRWESKNCENQRNSDTSDNQLTSI